MASKYQSEASTVLYSGVSPESGKAVGQHAHVGGAAEGEQNVARDIEAAGDERQAGQRDHGVAAPVGEPVIAGDHGVQIAAAADDELVGGGGQVGDQRIVDGRGGPLRRAAHELIAAQRSAVAASCVSVEAITTAFAPGAELKLHHERLKQVFEKIEAAFAFARVFEIVIPVRLRAPPSARCARSTAGAGRR